MYFDILTEHGIHPPSSSANPWETGDIPDTDHAFAPKDGVYEVYLNEEHLKNNKPCQYEYPNLTTFIADMNFMCNIIADGPL